MSLTELIAGVEEHEKTLTAYNADPRTVEGLRERFADRNVAVEAGGDVPGPDRFLVLSHDEEFLAAAGIDALLEEPERTTTGFGSDPYRPILDELDETTFTSYDPDRMLAATREIEDRAWRIGEGELHVGFQRTSKLEAQLEVYTRLGERDALTVHTYAVPDTDLPEQDAVIVHPERSEEIERLWIVAFDGAGVDENKCALLAEEREPDSFYGFWTYDPGTVDYVIDHLSESYLRPDAEGDRSTERRFGR